MRLYVDSAIYETVKLQFQL